MKQIFFLQRSYYFLFLFSLLLLTLFSHSVYAEEEFAVLYKGRYRSVEAYAHLWLYDLYHAPNLKKEDLSAFHTLSSSPLDLLWSLDILGYTSYQTAPLFWIKSVEIKKRLELPLFRNRFSYQELQYALNHIQEKDVYLDKKQTEEWSTLLFSIKEFARLYGPTCPIEEAFQYRWAELQAKGLTSKEIAGFLEQEYPLIQRLQNAGSIFKSLPSRYKEGDWFSLKALKVQMYHPSTQSLKEVDNFTLYSDEHFFAIRQAYFNLEKSYAEKNAIKIKEATKQLTYQLQQAYQTLAGTIAQIAHSKELTYPTLAQLKTETLYTSYPWIYLLIVIYGIGSCLLLISYRQRLHFGHLFAFGIILIAIFCHTLLLIMRCYILGRPPVSNMFETVIYVPWVATCASMLLPTFRRHPLALLAACVTSIGLLVILETADLNQSLDQVQAILDSQFWLLIHVLLVVGSYGIFILGGILGYFYLGMYMVQKQETLTMCRLSQMILQTMYVGTTLLVVGTILGGIWAAESWGRFWDWDPKESWAFISTCFYLIWIHAHRFHRIASFGLAIGAVSGLLAISFTWYGVNYILGTGLHSYGFGSGGEEYYYTFLGAEVLFLSAAFWSYFQRKLKKPSSNC